MNTGNAPVNARIRSMMRTRNRTLIVTLVNLSILTFTLVSCQGQGLSRNHKKMVLKVLDKQGQALNDVQVTLSLNQVQLTNDAVGFLRTDRTGKVSVDLNTISMKSTIMLTRSGYAPRAFRVKEGEFVVHLTQIGTSKCLPSGAIVEDLN